MTDEDDDLRPAAGVFNGLFISLVFWAVVAWVWSVLA